MNSVQGRHDLLRSMGLMQWYSKYTLPNTLATPKELFIDDLINHSQEMVVGVETKPSGIEDTNSMPPVLDIVKAELEPELPASANDSKSDNVLTPLSIVSLGLTLVRFKDLLVCYEGRSIESSSLGLEQALLHSIVRSINPHAEKADSAYSSFVWPPFLSSRLVSHQASYLDENLKQWFSRQDYQGVKRMLYFGDSFDQVERVVLEFRSELELDFVVVPLALTLSDLLSSPVKKKSFWSLLSKAGVFGD